MKMLVAVTVALLGTASYGYAQTEATGSPDTPVESEGSVSAESVINDDPAVMSDSSYEAAIIAIKTSGQVEFEPLDLADIRVVRLSELEGDATTEEPLLDEALDASSQAKSALHTSVGASDTLVVKLRSEGGFAATDVVAVNVASDGNLVVYVDDREGTGS